MKKFKLLAFVALSLVAVMVLSSCGTVANLNKIYNEEYDLTTDPYKAATKISDLKDYVCVSSNNYFAVFNKVNTDEVKTAVYSFTKDTILKTFISDDDITYSVELMDALCIVSGTTIPDDEDEDEVTTKTYLDATGKEVLSIDAKVEAGEPKMLYGNELVVINSAVYEINKDTGSVSKKMDVPAYIAVDGLYGYTGEHFYASGDNTIVIYDENFAPIATWVAPSYVDDMDEFILNNGDVLVQYAIELPEDAVFYDYFEDGVKYDLVSKIITVKGKERNVDLDYVVYEIIPNSYLYDEEADAEDNEYTDKFNNLATVAYIKNHRLDDNDFNMDIVLMNNSGKIEKSLKIVEGQDGYELPYMVGTDLYYVDTVYGAALVNGKGDVQFQITNSEVELYGEYIIATNAIYDLSFNKVYDLGANDARIIEKFGDTIFVLVGDYDDDEYSIISFGRGGKKNDVYKYDEDKEVYFELVYGIGYVIYEEGDDETTYELYSVAGTKLLDTKGRIDNVAYGKDAVIVSVREDDDINYFVIKK